MTGFGILIGKCYIVPPSAKAAMLLVAWMFGAIPGMSYADYRFAMLQQYPAAQAKAAVARIEQCFSDYPMVKG